MITKFFLKMCELRRAKKSANLWKVKKKGSANCELWKKSANIGKWFKSLKKRIANREKSAKNEKVRHFRDCHFGMRKKLCVPIMTAVGNVTM